VTGSSSPLGRYRDQELTLDGLAEAAAQWLRRLGLRPDDGRVAEGIDARGIRYYQTVGVIDRPVRYDGRRAVYGYRHLLQLLCVRKLQQEGHPLQLIQQALAGRPTDKLERALAATANVRPTAIRRGPIRLPALSERNRVEGRELAATPQLIAAQVAPGVTITIDTAMVKDPEAVVAAVEGALRAEKNADSQD